MSITKEYGEIFRIENGKAIKPKPEVILDNTVLTVDDLTDLHENEQVNNMEKL